MRLGKIGLRPLRRMIRMRMIKADDVLAALAPLALNADQFFGINVVAVVRRISARVAGSARPKSRYVHRHRPSGRAARRSTRGDRFLRRAGGSSVLLVRDLQHKRLIDTPRRTQRHRENPRMISLLRVFSVSSVVKFFYSSSQNLSLKYLSPGIAQNRDKHCALALAPASRATCRQPTTAAAAEIPTSSPSSRARRLAML